MRNQIERLVNTLRRVALFNELSEGELRVLAERTVRKRYEAGAVIFFGRGRVPRTADRGRRKREAIQDY
jgi:hypothetical protein